MCKAWYCSPLCQANHWAVHRRECIPIPGLEWPDGTRYQPQGQVERFGYNLHEGVTLPIDGPTNEDESVNMKDMLVGREMTKEDEKESLSNETSSEAANPIIVSSTKARSKADVSVSVTDVGDKSRTKIDEDLTRIY